MQCALIAPLGLPSVTPRFVLDCTQILRVAGPSCNMTAQGGIKKSKVDRDRKVTDTLCCTAALIGL
jgi:hypothetical protein